MQAIIDACKKKIINAKIELVISNKDNAYGLVRANNNNILNKVVKYNRKKESRKEYELRLINEIEKYISDIDLVILAGWMLLLTPVFINKFNNKIINLHPALPGQFPGINAIERAYISYKNNRI